MSAYIRPQPKRGPVTYTRHINPDGTRMRCSVHWCEHDAKQKTMCLRHYNQALRGTPLTPHATLDRMLVDGVRVPCVSEGCDKPAYCKRLCRMHYTRSKRPSSSLKPVKGHVCEVDACGAPRAAKGLCERHYKMLRKYGVTDRPDYATCPVRGCGRNMAHASRICKRCNQFRWRYSLTAEDVIHRNLEENYKCSNAECAESRDLHLDHAHTCCPDGKFETAHKKSCGLCVRGWLCRGCNFAIGFMQESPRKLRGLLVFLSQFEDD